MSKGVERNPAKTVTARGPRRRSRQDDVQAPAVPATAEFDLADAVPYLVTRAGMRMGQAFSKQLRSFDLNLAEWRVCAALHERPHQRLSDLAVQTTAEPSTLSRIVDGMIQRKLVARERSEDDARAIALRLTPEGVDLTQRVIPLAQLYERVALAGLSKPQVDSLKAMLRKLYDNMAVLDPGS
ncbi:MarR family transcriptional regulator [Ramlibacter sp. AW1]|uniref:MarR family transcriptional regulator n=1 Tax=Ramlibacter aurantiacus TaxID=2801330 RepID=A0A937D0P2_9BURK|nr:MarR family transcriptional regulator [Ramlibacter aurantiacus]MBL0419644.1 MarR family transcriptional regulator [Ramlibacter aurantiacus]